jgi:hypothetical protein
LVPLCALSAPAIGSIVSPSAQEGFNIMVTATRSARSGNRGKQKPSIQASKTMRSLPRQLPVESRNIKKVFVVALTTKRGEQACYPELFDNITDAKREAKIWRTDDTGFSCIADAQVRRVARVIFAD